ncbi:hypothetical protein I4F81_011089 [Pyropia yezoensis]|uniref:Uncharacterized protein n=1 Tax=Pyropia yezoensis TaxID=2788 RepID=A0ACC3CEK7_PYRYE|nr:hypothetical protein I4F81_011089 [Neopyropia yezoensis]
MSGAGARVAVVPSRMTLQQIKGRLAGAKKGHSMLQEKAHALTVRLRSILKDILEKKECAGEQSKDAMLALAMAKYAFREELTVVMGESVDEEASCKSSGQTVPVSRNRSVSVRGIEFTAGASGFVVPTAGSSVSAAQRFAQIYKVTMIAGRVRNVRVLVRSVRETEQADVKRYVQSFSTTGYDWAHGMTKVTEDFTQEDRALPALEVGEDGVLEDKSDRQYVTVDEHHRQTALVTILERGLPNASENCRPTSTTWWASA